MFLFVVVFHRFKSFVLLTFGTVNNSMWCGKYCHALKSLIHLPIAVLMVDNSSNIVSVCVRAWDIVYSNRTEQNENSGDIEIILNHQIEKKELGNPNSF